MTKIILETSDITKYKGDALILPCDVDLAQRHTTPILHSVYKLAGNKLQEEIAAIGFCDIGNAVITKGYNLKVAHIIFLPYTDNTDSSKRMDNPTFHKAFRSALTLASIYGVKTIALHILPLINIKGEEITDIIMVLLKEYEGRGFEEVTLFK